MKISTHSIVVAGVLIAVSAVLSLTGLGYFPIPNVTAAATIMQVPAIIGGVLEGPVVGLIVGIVFGLSAYTSFAGLPFFVGQPFWVPIVVLFVPRLLIGVVAAYVYRWLHRSNEILALAVAGVAGTLTNTVLVIGLGVALGLQIVPGVEPGLPQLTVLIPILTPQVIFECVIAAILTVAVVAAWKQIERGRGGSSV